MIPTRALQRWIPVILIALCSQSAFAQLDRANSRLFLRNTADGFPFAILGRLDPAVNGFGEAMAVGDFNCDGIDDVAIGAPDANANNIVHSGQVVIAYGSLLGLRSNDGIGLSQDSLNIQDTSEVGDYFGFALAAGPLTNDDCDDLVVGTPGEDIGSFFNLQDAGSLTFLYGSPSGMTGLSTFNVPLPNESSGTYALDAGDRYGSALAIGNVYSASGTLSELIIGLPGFTVGQLTTFEGGAVHIRAADNFDPLRRGLGRFFDYSCCNQSMEVGDHFGHAFAVGNFDGDGLPDVAIGIPGQDVNGYERAGSVAILYGGLPPLGLGGWLNFNQNSPGVPENSRDYDRFGSVLAAGDFDADGDSDLVIGVPRKTAVAGADDRTGVLIIRNGRSDGVNGFELGELWTNEEVGLPTNSRENYFASALAIGDFNGDGYEDLAAGAPGVNVNGVVDSGAVVVMYGSAEGVSLEGRQIWHKARTAIPGSLAEGDEFGAGLAAGDFNNDGADDLIIGIPQQRLGATPRGGVLVIYGRSVLDPADEIFADGFEP